MLAASAPVVLLLLSSASAVSVAVENQDRSYVEIGARKLEVHSQNSIASSAGKRLIRQQGKPEAKGLDDRQSTVALVEDSEDAEVLAESLVDRTIRAFHDQKELGPGTLEKSEDAFNASLGSMRAAGKDLTFDCNLMYGEEMLKRMMDDRHVHHICSGKQSTLTCHERHPFDVPRYTCELRKVMLSSQGVTASGCQKSGDFDEFFGQLGITENNIFGKYTKFGGLRLAYGDLECKQKVARKALVQVPSNIDNFYEWYGDWLTLYETLAAYKWHPKDVDLYLVGSTSLSKKAKYQRPFDEAWDRAFPVVHVGSYDELFGDGTCFNHLVTVPQGSLSTMTFRGGRGGVVGCLSPTVMSSALWLQALFAPKAATEKELGKVEANSRKQVTLMLRKGRRQFESDRAAIQAIKEVLPSDWDLVEYRPEDVNDFTEQLSIVSKSQVFVGVHGAGMMHVLFLPPKARVVEIFCEDRPRENHHYRNLEEMSEPSVGSHLFSYYFEASSQRCKMDGSAVRKAIKAYEKDLVSVEAATPSPAAVAKPLPKTETSSPPETAKASSKSATSSPVDAAKPAAKP
jgi:hypothetical protein